jgi:nicotinamidase-related amidase
VSKVATIQLAGSKVPGEKVALIIVDVWNLHWCKASSDRVDKILAPMIGRLLPAMRANGVQIIHAPSETQGYYEKLVDEQRKREPGCFLIKKRSWDNDRNERDNYGGIGSFDDTRNQNLKGLGDLSGGNDDCDSEERPEWNGPWTKEHEAIDPNDPKKKDAAKNDIVIFENERQRLTQFLIMRGIEHLVYSGVHTNMCVLRTRNISLKNMIRGSNDLKVHQSHKERHPELQSYGELRCYLARDLTDAMLSKKTVRSQNMPMVDPKACGLHPDLATPGTRAVLHWIANHEIEGKRVPLIPSSELVTAIP